MIVKHLRRDFYEVLYGKRILILANGDVDSVCTCKILTELLRMDAIAFSLLPVDGLATFQDTFKEYSQTVQVVILINCGIGIDLLQMLDQPKDKIFFVIDSHRPIHIANYYNETNQIRLLTLDEKINIPAFDDIFRVEASDSEEEEEDDEEELDSEGNAIMGSEDEDSSPVPGRKRKRHNSGNKRKDYTDWLNRRQEKVFDYTEFSYFAPPSALIALELSWSMNRGDTQYVWWAIVALTDALVLERMPRREYTLKSTQLHTHVVRISHANNTPRDCLKVTYEAELCFYLYRHWNLYDSIKMSPHSASTFKTWTLKGESRFHEMLAELGLPLTQCRQNFKSMELKFRKKVKEAFTLPLIKDKYEFDDITIGSFVSEIGFRPKQSAFDTQLACSALLENPDVHLSTTDKFMEALESLSKTSYGLQDKGLELAKVFMKATYRQVQAFMNMNHVQPRGGYLFVQLPAGAPDASYFVNPSCMLMLAQFTQKAAVASNKSRRWRAMPMVLCAPHSPDWWSIAGIRPINCDLPKNQFGKLFETLADKLADKVLMDAFDPNIIQVKSEDKDMFLDCLEAIML